MTPLVQRLRCRAETARGNARCYQAAKYAAEAGMWHAYDAEAAVWHAKAAAYDLAAEDAAQLEGARAPAAAGAGG